MPIFELLVLIVVLAFVMNGMRAGSIETLGRLLGAVIGFLAAKYYSSGVVNFVAAFLPLKWAYPVAFVLIFLIVDFVVGMVFRVADLLLKIFTRLPILKQIDKLLGAFFGFIEAVIVIGGVNWLLRQGTLADSGLSFLSDLKSAAFIDRIFQVLLTVIPF